jgi:hypothetical protein
MKKLIIGTVILLITRFSVARANDNHHAPLEIPGRMIYPAGVHNILSDQLPAMLRAHIREDYKGYWITELYEEGSRRDPSYSITVENADQIIKMSATDSENWIITSTTPKG